MNFLGERTLKNRRGARLDRENNRIHSIRDNPWITTIIEGEMRSRWGEPRTRFMKWIVMEDTGT